MHTFNSIICERPVAYITNKFYSNISQFARIYEEKTSPSNGTIPRIFSKNLTGIQHFS